MERGVGTPMMLCRGLVVPEEEQVALQGRSWALGMLTAACVRAGPSSFFYFSCPPQGFLYILLRGQLQLSPCAHFQSSDTQAPVCFCPNSLSSFLF